MGTLTGEVALITGSTHGIGAEIARLFAAEGASVAIHGRDGAAARVLATQIIESGHRAAAVTGDLSDEHEAERVVRHTEAALGPISILIANAGGNPVPPGPVEAMSAEQWRSALDANLTLTFRTIAATLPRMKERRRGSIVTISSAAARRPTVQTPVAYAAAKAGIEVLTRIVALQAGPFGIRANCIAPETILTDSNATRIPQEIQQQMAATHPLRRLGTPGDVAAAALYLASDRAAWTTGVILDIAGGSVLA